MKKRTFKKSEFLEGTRLSYNAADQAQYYAAISKLIDRMANETERAVIKLFKSPAAKTFFDSAMDADISSQSKILLNKLTEKFNKLFSKMATPLAESMIKSSGKSSNASLKTSLKKISEGLTIKTSSMSADLKTMLKAHVAENVELIKTISSDYLSRVQKAVMRSITQEDGLSYLIPYLKKFKGYSYRKAKNVALDQTRKAYNTMNKSRMEKAGFTKFKWLHSGGGREPRKSHIALNNTVWSFDNLPIVNQEQVDRGYEAPRRGIPGQEPNCGCTMTPVYEFEEDPEE